MDRLEGGQCSGSPRPWAGARRPRETGFQVPFATHCAVLPEARFLFTKDTTAKDIIAKDNFAKNNIAKDNIAKDSIANDNIARDIFVNKSILVLITAVFVIGAALVVFNQQQTPEPKVAAERSLPALPAPEPSPMSGDLQPLPKLPAPIANDRASVRAPVIQEEAPGDAADRTTSGPAGSTQPQGAQTSLTADAGAGAGKDAESGARPGAGHAAETAVAAADAAKAAEAPHKAGTRPEAEQQDAGQKAAEEKPIARETAEEKPAEQKLAEHKAAEEKPAAPKAAEHTRAEAGKQQARIGEPTRPAVDTTIQPKITVFSRENGATVRVKLPAAISYKQQRLTNPERIVVDINGLFRNLRAPGVPANPLVTNVRLGFQSNNTTRIVVDLKEKPRRERVLLSEDRQQLDIRVDR